MEKKGPVASISSRKAQREDQSTSEGTGRSQEQLRRGQRQRKLAQNLPTKLQDSQIETFSCGQCVQYGQSPYGDHSQGAGKNEQNPYMQITDELSYIQAIKDIKFNNFDKELKKLTSKINDLNTMRELSPNGSN
ncbi:hypothetical protein O181_031226 [Austropuccinia psidii MF-1]|uniref:Uncharacterized protein n=1 Tax=Austropuccinia psidii MF-1 TaxID=1389203 RepID=A0A9Q3D024_9BASI|nr:hypothetical protein [Austropuccinia psidii MF-1]